MKPGQVLGALLLAGACLLKADPGIYPIKRRADTLRSAGKAKGGKALSQWVVLPAQSGRLRGASR